MCIICFIFYFQANVMTLLFFRVLQVKQKARHLLCLKLSSAFIKHPAGHLTAFLALLIDLNISPLLFGKKKKKSKRAATHYVGAESNPHLVLLAVCSNSPPSNDEPKLLFQSCINPKLSLSVQ